jgi:RecA/RadA recombinase
MVKKVKEKGKAVSFLELSDSLNKISPEGDILENSIYAKIDEWINTGSYIFNACLSGSLFGGMPNRRSMTLAGEEGTGKTYLALSICKHAQYDNDYNIIYCDTEGGIDIDFVKRLGLDTQKCRLENIGTIEKFATLAAQLNTTVKEIRDAGKEPPKVMVVLDSLGNLSSTKETEDTTSGSGKRDMTKQQAIRRTFRVIGNDFAKNGIPFIICNHVYAAIGSFFPHNEVSGGGGIRYSSSIILMLTKSKLADKDSEEHVKKQGIEATKIGIVITITPLKQRFARPIKVQIHLPFYKKPNPYVGLEKFVTWDNCGVVRGKMLTEKEYKKLSDAEQKECFEFMIPVEGLKSGDDGTRFAQPKDTARTLVCKHLGEVPLVDLYTSKVFTDDVLHQLDSNIIRPTFMLPSIESLEDLAEVTEDLESASMDNAEVYDNPSEYEDLIGGSTKEIED